MDEDFPYASVVVPTDQVLMSKPKHYDVYPILGEQLLATNPALFELNENNTLNNSNLADYDAKEETTALYGMGTWRSGRHTIIGGLRMEKNEWNSERKDVDLVTRAVTPRNVGSSYTFWLPGIHFRHELTKNLILRESFNQSYGRPSLAQLTRGRTIALNGNITDGNADLDPAFSDNFEVQLEYYTAQSGLYSVGVFYKDVEDFSFTQVGRFDSVDANGDPILVDGGEFQYSVPQNGSTAKNMGVEIIARQRLYFLPSFLKGFTAGISATFTETDATFPNRTDDRDLPLPGFSEYLFTASLEYAWGNFFARADYRYRDDYVEGLGSNIESDEFFSAEEKVDAEVGYQLREGLTIFAQGTNLTDRPQVSYQGFRPFVEDASISGRKYTVGVEYRF
jgi:TonB-dependent receptor